MIKYKRISIASVVLATMLGGVAMVTAASASPPIPVPTGTVTQSWGAQSGSFTQPPVSGPVADDPVGICTAEYDSGTGDYFNEAIATSYCTSDITSIYVTSDLYSKGSNIASSSGTGYDSDYVSKTASHNCESVSLCEQGDAYSGSGATIFTVAGETWSGDPSPGCATAGDELACTLAYGPWNW